MNKIQERCLESFKRNVMEEMYRSTKESYEIKKFEVKDEVVQSYRGKEKSLVFVVVETGLKNDEGTMASVLARNYRHILIKSRGGVELLNCRKQSSRYGWHNAYHALTR